MNLFDTFNFDWLKQIVDNTWSLFIGILTMIVGYFLPVKNIVNLVLFFFMLDIIFGYWAARKLRREKFSTKIVWQYTMPRVLISIVLIIATYMWDTEFNQEIISTYKLIGWFISGILIYSVLKNAYKITNWMPFNDISGFLQKKVEDETGINIAKEKEKQ